MLRKLETRKRDYKIVDLDYSKIPQQKQLVEFFKNREQVPTELRKRYNLYYGGNWSWKTLIWAYITACLAIWDNCSKYNLPRLGHKKLIWIGTKSWSNVKWVIDPYLLWDYSHCKIPPDEIEKVNYDNTILKSIQLKNGTKIQIYTYDQWYANWQGWNPDFIWLDEEPTDEMVFIEAIARMRNINCEMMITMTPLSWLTRIYDYFVNTEIEEVKSKTNVYSINSMDNPFTDKTWTYGLTEEEYNMRVLGMFDNPTWLVYKEFKKPVHVIPKIDLRTLWDNTKYYRSIDFWTSHPTWVLFIAIDEDNNIIIFDEIKKSNTLLSDIRDLILTKSNWLDIEQTFRDSAAKREWFELQKLGITTIPANKHSKWENEMSNRRTWILMVNQLFKNKKLFITENCTELIKELQTHSYKISSKDWEVIKENDDLLDALRYAIFSLKYNKLKTSKMESYEKRYKEKLMGTNKWKISFL